MHSVRDSTYCNKCKYLHSGFQHPEQLHLVFRNDLPERDKDADLQSHLAMVLLTIAADGSATISGSWYIHYSQEGRTSEDDELDPVQAERDDI